MISEVEAVWTKLHGPMRPPPAADPKSGRIPMYNSSTEDYFAKRTRVRTGMHSIMASETLNFVDGKRSYLGIYLAVKAESLSAGKFFYGTVTYEDVEKLLDANVKSGALILK